ncbi:MAG: NADP-dependent oxidoreductase [Proteobacteria bacterium]|nr:NADP-dependent oxidoreductase [Pseudomonadota bacterium]
MSNPAPSLTSREVRLAARPQGEPRPTDFELAEAEVPEPAEGQVLVRNLVMSVDPYMRGRMNDVKSYAVPYEVDGPMYGGAVGEVVASEDPRVPVGTFVQHELGWRTHSVVPARAAVVVDPEQAPLPSCLGVLGMPGMTAWVGLFDIGAVRPGETVWISAASGAVGSLAGQLAKLAGCRVVGSAGGDDKCRYVVEQLGFDACIDYRQGALEEQLAGAAPDGVDVYFDNVGGDHLEAAISALKVHGRACICGMISAYNATTPPAAPRNLGQVVGKRLRPEGMLVRDHAHLQGEFVREVGQLLADGRLTAQETVVDGIEHAVDAFLGLLSGRNTGKMVVRVG